MSPAMLQIKAPSLDRAFLHIEGLKFAEGDDTPPASFSGYGAVFGNMDLGGDVIVKGAFRDTLREWKKRKALPPMLSQHGMMGDDAIPIGVWSSMEEDDTGLKVEGHLIALDSDKGKRIHAAMKAGVLNGMSIGYRVKSFDYGTKPDQPRRTIKSLDLVELSVVTFPMNEQARVQRVKAADVLTKKDFEKALRDAGFSKNDAAFFAAGWTPPARRDAVGGTDALAFLRGAIETLKQE